MKKKIKLWFLYDILHDVHNIFNNHVQKHSWLQRSKVHVIQNQTEVIFLLINEVKLSHFS